MGKSRGGGLDSREFFWVLYDLFFVSLQHRCSMIYLQKRHVGTIAFSSLFAKNRHESNATYISLLPKSDLEAMSPTCCFCKYIKVYHTAAVPPRYSDILAVVLVWYKTEKFLPLGCYPVGNFRLHRPSAMSMQRHRKWHIFTLDNVAAMLPCNVDATSHWYVGATSSSVAIHHFWQRCCNVALPPCGHLEVASGMLQQQHNAMLTV